MDLPQKRALFSPFEIDVAKKLAVGIDPNELQVLPHAEGPVKDLAFTPKFPPPAMREGVFWRCTFDRINFCGSNAAQVVLKDCRLRQCSVADANFKASDFTGSDLDFDASASSFDSSDFTNATLLNTNLEGCSFTESDFTNAQIVNCKIVHSEFVAAKFSRAYLKDSDMVKTNLDYSEFERTSFVNVTLPYWGVLHVVKGLWEILSADGVRFSTADGMHCVERDQYIEEISLLRPYFYQNRDFLALANLYIFDGEYEKAYDMMLLGIGDACKHGRLSRLKYLCRMASLNKFFSRAQLRMLYRQIETSISSGEFSPMQYKNYLQELDSAKRLLLDQPFELDTIFITIQTTIQSDDYEKRLLIQKMLDQMISETAPEAVSHMEVRHNSPLEFVIQVSENVWQLLVLFAMVDFAFDKSTTYIERLQNILLNHKKTHQDKRNSPKIEQLEKQISEMQETIEKLEHRTQGKNALILPGMEEFQRISYTLYTKDPILAELRTYSSK